MRMEASGTSSLKRITWMFLVVLLRACNSLFQILIKTTKQYDARMPLQWYVYTLQAPSNVWAISLWHVVSGLAPSCEQHSLCYERDFVKRFYKSQRYYK